jgi:anaerobic C4-dicarboxylate transporter DcuB
VSKLVNSQAAALTAVAPMGLMLGIEPKMLIAFFPASYGYFVLPTYPSDLACIGFDRSGTTRIGKFIINHSFILPGLIGVLRARQATCWSRRSSDGIEGRQILSPISTLQ